MKSMKKHLKQVVQLENETLLNNDENYLEEVLIPKSNNNSGQKVKQHKFIFNPMTKVLVGFVCVCLVLGTTYLIVSNNNYAGTYINQETNIEYLNDNLIHTQIKGEFNSVIMTCKGKNNNPIYFNLTHEFEATETDLISCTLSVIIDRDYEPLKLEYVEQITFGDYVVNLNRTSEINSDEEFSVYSYTIKAYFDTGAERYLISFDELTTNNSDSFENYLNLVINKKEKKI